MAAISSSLPSQRYRRLIGRSAQVQQALTTLGARSPGQNVLIHGAAGSGKTSVAVEIARHIADRQADSSLPVFESLVWLSARPAILTADGVLRSPLVCGTLNDFITNICAVLDRPDILRALPSEQSPLLRAALSRHPTLIVADDLDEVEDERVLAFLSSLPDTCRVVATCRTQLAFGRPIKLEPLSAAEARELLQQIETETGVHFSDAEARRMHELCGGIPLAVVWAVNLVRLGYTIPYILNNFGETSSDLLRFCFFKTWESIKDTAAADLLVAIALFADGATAELASLASGLTATASDFEVATVRLRRLGVLEATTTRLTLLPMTRTYLLENIVTPTSGFDSDQARDRWMAALVVHVDRCLAQTRWQDCFDLLEPERANLEALFDWARTRQDEDLYFRAAVLYSDLSYYLFSRGYWRQLVENAAWALPALREQDLGEEYLTILLTWVSRVHLLHGDIAKLNACFAEAEQFISTAPEESLPLYRAIFLYNQATHLISEPGKHNAPTVTTTLRRIAETFRAQGRDEWFARVCNRLGNLLSAAGDFDAAIAAFSDVSAVAAVHLDAPWGKDMAGIAKGNLGILANRQGRHAEAIPLLEESRELVAQAMDGAVALIELAIAHDHIGARADAVVLARKAYAAAADLELGISIAESDTRWEKDVLPRLIAELEVAEESTAASAEAVLAESALAEEPASTPAFEEITRLLDQAFDAGIADLDTQELEEQLGLQLRDLVMEAALVSATPQEWAAGDYGPVDLGRRFIDFHRKAIKSQLCKPGCQGLKPEYARMLAPGGPRTDKLAPIAAGLLIAFQGAGAGPVIAIPMVAVYVTLWLVRADLDYLCRQP